MNGKPTSDKFIERKTFISGRFSGKYAGRLSAWKYYDAGIQYYDIEILSGAIKTQMSNDHVRHWHTGEDALYQQTETLKCSFPDEMPLIIQYTNKDIKEFLVHLQSPKIQHANITNQVYDENMVFGDITGDISGYISHWVEAEKEDTIILPTKEKEVHGDYTRYKSLLADGSTKYGDWQYQSSRSSGCLSDIFGLIGNIVLWGFLLLVIITTGWKILVPIAGVLIFYFLCYLFFAGLFWLIRVIFRPLILLLIIFSIFSLYGIFSSTSQTDAKPVKVQDSIEETNKTLPDENMPGDSLIIHHRKWVDMEMHSYSKDIIVRKSDFNMAKLNHRDQVILSYDENGYRDFLVKLQNFDRTRMSHIFDMLDSINTSVSNDKIRFVKAVVTMVQDIPYTLILPNACNALLYRDEFTKQYLKNNGECVGNVKFGLHSPLEFMSTLQGDCDTRTLFLFTVLDHYGYDVALMGSDLYQHSVLGINLPFQGLNKMSGGKKYYVWETTAAGIPPGVLNKDISDMQYWTIILKSKN